MDSQSKKKLANFKKEIVREQFEIKKRNIRKELPYYDEMFKQIDESSNETNSRSSRFPIRSGSSKQKPIVFGQTKALSSKERKNENQEQQSYEYERQLKYLEFLKNINSTFSLQDNVLVEKAMTQKYGLSCFQNIQLLRAQIYCDLMAYQTNFIYQSQNQNNLLNQFTCGDWNFVLASYKIAQNERFEQISRSSFILMTGLFNQWYFLKIKKIILQNKGNSIDTIFDIMKNMQDTQIGIDEIMFSKLIQNTHQQIDTQAYQMLTKYLLQKINTFEGIQRELLKNYEVQETQWLSQMIFNFGFIHAIEILAETSQIESLDMNLRVEMLNAVNRYFTMYPVNIQSETETKEKFNAFIFKYLKCLISFFQQFQLHNSVNISLSLHDPLFHLLKSSQSLIRSLLWRDTDSSCDYQILSIYQHLINISLTTDQLIVRVQQFKDFHTEMIQFSLTFFVFIENSKFLFTLNSYLQYVSLLFFYFHQMKLKIRNQTHFCNIPLLQQNNSISHAQKFLKFQFYLIYALHIIKRNSLNENNQQFSKNVNKLLLYTEFVYNKEQITCEKCNYQISQNYLLIFMTNVKIYFRLFINPEKQNFVPNPQNQETSNYYHQQIEI